MTRNQIILANIILAIPIIPIMVVLFILYWLTKWVHEGVDWMFDRFLLSLMFLRHRNK